MALCLKDVPLLRWHEYGKAQNHNNHQYIEHLTCKLLAHISVYPNECICVVQVLNRIFK